MAPPGGIPVDAEPPAKKAKTDEAGGWTAVQEELETDAPKDAGPRIKDGPAFLTEDTTLNVMPSSTGNMLTTLSEGGLQYLFAGARCNVGLKSGRYAFEVKIMEVMAPLDDPNARARVPQPRAQLRIGVTTAQASMLFSDEDGMCFDSEGAMIKERKKTSVSAKFTTGDVVCVVLNLDKGRNENTLSIFKDGVRACPPQPLPESVKGKALFFTVAFRNVAFYFNFGPDLMAPLPFKCRTVKDASQKDATVKPPTAVPRDGRYEALFPVCLPDEGSFDWLDNFLQKNPHYTELSDRALLNWCEKSGIQRPKGYSAGARASNDKPEMALGIANLDDLSVRRVLQAVASMQKRHIVVMEVRSNLLQDERAQLALGWSAFKRVAMVLVGDPPADMVKYIQVRMLQAKQEASDAEHKAKFMQERQRKETEKRQKLMEREKKKALKKQQKLHATMQKKAEHERLRKEAEARGETYPPYVEEEEKDEEDEEEEEEVAEEEPVKEEPPPTMSLTAVEKKMTFRRLPASDLTSYTQNIDFQKFSLPEKSEPFDEIKYIWHSEVKAKPYLRDWIQMRKMTSRVEDLQPSEWFNGKWKEWQKILQSYHGKQNAYKAAENKKTAEAAAKEARKKEREAAREKALKEGTELPPEEEVEETKEDSTASKADVEHLDVFGVEDVTDMGAGEPLFSAFNFEDWTMMGLRYEMHLLAHGFRRDVNDPDRMNIPLEHLAFYYTKYYRKALNTKFYGVDSVEELLDLIRDTVVVVGKSKREVMEPELPADLESPNLFVMLTEESRRDRNRRVDMGDDTAKLKIAAPGQAGTPSTVVPKQPAGAPPWVTQGQVPQLIAPRPAHMLQQQQQQPQQPQQQQPQQQQPQWGAPSWGNQVRPGMPDGGMKGGPWQGDGGMKGGPWGPGGFQGKGFGGWKGW